MNTQVVGFKKIKFHTMENVGSGELTLPEQEMHTTAFWLTLPRSLMDELPYNSTERLDGVNGLANALGAIATLLVMCDARDLGMSAGENAELEVSEPSGNLPASAGMTTRVARRQLRLSPPRRRGSSFLDRSASGRASAPWCERFLNPTSISMTATPEAWD